MRSLPLLAIVTMLAAAPVRAETLDDAMRAAMDSNPSIAASRARLDAAREAVPQARAAALPSLSASAGATSSRSRTEPGAGGATVENENSPWNAGLSASQLLFASGGVAANIRGAKAQVAGAEADYRATEQNFLLDVVTAYARFREAEAIVAARTKSAANLEEQRKYAKARFEAGVSTRTDFAQAEAALAQARTQLIQAQGQLAAANETYTRLIGHPPSALEPVGPAAGLPPTLPDALTEAVAANPTLISARAGEDQARANLSAARSAFGPRITLEAGTSLSSSFDDFADQTEGDSVGLRFSLPLFTGGLNASRAKQASSLNTAASLDRNAAETQLRETVTTAWTNLNTTRAALASAREQVQAAELAYRGVTLEQQVGLRAQVEVLDSENTLLTARLALAAAERDQAIAERQLLAAIGALAAPE